jgi:hypothetical protein
MGIDLTPISFINNVVPTSPFDASGDFFHVSYTVESFLCSEAFLDVWVKHSVQQLDSGVGQPGHYAEFSLLRFLGLVKLTHRVDTRSGGWDTDPNSALRRSSARRVVPYARYPAWQSMYTASRSHQGKSWCTVTTFPGETGGKRLDLPRLGNALLVMLQKWV